MRVGIHRGYPSSEKTVKTVIIDMGRQVVGVSQAGEGNVRTQGYSKESGQRQMRT